MITSTFYLSLSALLISLGSGIYFLAWWLQRRKKYPFLIYWAYGLGALLWFKIPNILANAGFEIVQQEFYLFFFVTLLAYFLAYFALIRGLVFFRKSPHNKRVLGFFAMWFGAAVIYFALSFFAGYELTYAPVWAGHLFFYIPVQLFLLYKLWQVVKESAESIAISRIGATLTAAGVLVSITSSVFYIFIQTGPYPQEFWYFSVISSSSISLLQIISGLLLFFGLHAIARSYLRNIK